MIKRIDFSFLEGLMANLKLENSYLIKIKEIRDILLTHIKNLSKVNFTLDENKLTFYISHPSQKFLISSNLETIKQSIYSQSNILIKEVNFRVIIERKRSFYKMNKPKIEIDKENIDALLEIANRIDNLLLRNSLKKLLNAQNSN